MDCSDEYPREGGGLSSARSGSMTCQVHCARFGVRGPIGLTAPLRLSKLSLEVLLNVTGFFTLEAKGLRGTAKPPLARPVGLSTVSKPPDKPRRGILANCPPISSVSPDLVRVLKAEAGGVGDADCCCLGLSSSASTTKLPTRSMDSRTMPPECLAGKLAAQ